MMVLVCLICGNSRIRKAFEESGTKMLSADWMPANLAKTVSFITVSYVSEVLNNSDFERFIEEESCVGGILVNGIVVLYEEPYGVLVDRIRNAIFGAEIPIIGYAENIQNFLTARFLVLLKNFGVVTNLMSPATQYQAAALPLRNFNARELRAVVDICQTQALNAGFPNAIKNGISRLLRLRGPKRRSKYPHIYFIDENQRYFQYGHEKHSSYPTGGDHRLSCAINGQFRFGNALEPQRHYNVSMGNSDKKRLITCHLPNCHDVPVDTVSEEYINMFSNDFHG